MNYMYYNYITLLPLPLASFIFSAPDPIFPLLCKDNYTEHQKKLCIFINTNVHIVDIF